MLMLLQTEEDKGRNHLRQPGPLVVMSQLSASLKTVCILFWQLWDESLFTVAIAVGLRGGSPVGVLRHFLGCAGMPNQGN